MEDKKEERRGDEMRGRKRMGKKGGGRVEGRGASGRGWRTHRKEFRKEEETKVGGRGWEVVDEIQKLFLPPPPIIKLRDWTKKN